MRNGEEAQLDEQYPSVPGVLSELIRTAFIPREGEKFIVADFSAVEARALSWLAGERWRVEVFHDGRDIYCESAARMFHCVVEKNGQNSHLRPRGKVAELALGYGGGVGALRKLGAVQMGVPENLTQALCQDLLAFAMKKLQSYCIVAHVHDEVILEVPRSVPVEEITETMSRTPPWTLGLELHADGSELDFYMKS